MLNDFLDSLDAQTLFRIAKDIDCEEQAHNLNDYDEEDLKGVIVEWVEDGVKRGSWTEENWIKEVKEGYVS